jgi:hypothetical protein
MCSVSLPKADSDVERSPSADSHAMMLEFESRSVTCQCDKGNCATVRLPLHVIAKLTPHFHRHHDSCDIYNKHHHYWTLLLPPTLNLISPHLGTFKSIVVIHETTIYLDRPHLHLQHVRHSSTKRATAHLRSRYSIIILCRPRARHLTCLHRWPRPPNGA